MRVRERERHVRRHDERIAGRKPKKLDSAQAAAMPLIDSRAARVLEDLLEAATVDGSPWHATPREVLDAASAQVAEARLGSKERKLAADVKPNGGPPAFVTFQIGSFRADAVKKSGAAPVTTIDVQIDSTGGYTVDASGKSISLQSANVSGDSWQPRENGAVRKTEFGSETVTVGVPNASKKIVTRPIVCAAAFVNLTPISWRVPLPSNCQLASTPNSLSFGRIMFLVWPGCSVLP